VQTVVTGATGFVGSHLVDALLAGGARVRCLVRATSRTDRLPAGVDLAPVSLDDEQALRAAVAGAEVVFHVAGLIKALHADEYVRANVVGTRNLALACASAAPAPRRRVLVSSQAAAGPAMPSRPADERDPPRPVSAYGHSKLAAERAALASAGPVEVAIARPSTVYGPRDRALRPLFRLVSLGVAPRLSVDPAVSLLYVDDLVRLLLALAEHPAAAGRTYFAAGPALRLSEIVALIGDGFGRRPRSIPVPDVALVAAGLAADGLSRLTGQARPFGRRKALEMLHGGWVCSPERAARELGFRALVGHADGFRATAAWYRRRGWR
jgi:nucleoside-diphosphate-sugar epimerase